MGTFRESRSCTVMMDAEAPSATTDDGDAVIVENSGDALGATRRETATG
jgi:hypothetical protein